MSTIPLDRLDEYLLKQIVRKFTATSGAAFYGSCRGAKDLVDRVKPVWHFPKLMIRYEEGKRYIKRTAFRRTASRKDKAAKVALEFCRFEEVKLCRDTDYIKTVVLPEVAAVGGVAKLFIGEMSEGDVPLLISAAKPEAVVLLDDHIDPHSAIFEGVKNLWLNVSKVHVESYWRTKKLFELARNRKTINCFYWAFTEEIIASFIKNWLKGEKTGTLERLSFILPSGYRTAEERRAILKAMEILMKNHIKTEKGYILERGGLHRLRICADFHLPRIVFHFS